MERFYYEIPSMEKKDEIIDFLNEFAEYGSDLNGSGALDKIFEGLTFEEALDSCLKLKDEEYAKSINRSPSKTFLLVRENDNRIVGTINVRWNLNESMLQFGGHIGYSIRPTERRKGYNKINLYLGLKKAREVGLDKVMLDCSANNVGSDKSIKALGGVLERSEVDPYDNELTNVYWIDVNDSLEKYKDTYEQYVVNNNRVMK